MQNRQYLVTGARFEVFSDAYVSSDDPSRNLFDCAFTAIRADNTFRPARITPRARVAGPQTAVVVGPEGDEILTDKYGE